VRWRALSRLGVWWLVAVGAGSGVALVGLGFLRVGGFVLGASLLVAALLVYAVIAALGSDGGAKAGVAIAYIIGAVVLCVAAAALWRRPVRGSGPVT